MTVVTRIQRAFTGQASEHPVAARPASATDYFDADNITFHPELLTQWDDEADYVDRDSCVRPGRIGARPALRSANR